MKSWGWLGSLVIFLLGCDAPLGIERASRYCAEHPAGAVLPTVAQTPGDCLQMVCNARGEFEQVPMDDDVPKGDADSCLKKTCVAGHVESVLVEMTVCYSGPAETLNVGRCHAGAMMCSNGAPSGACVGEVVPTQESCATPEDDDCDGLVNEEGPDCGCTTGESRTCYSGPANTLNIGTCHAGTQTCNGSGTGFGPCMGETTPQSDVCDSMGADENCDGIAECAGQTASIKVFGSSAGDETLWAVAADGLGNIFLSGQDSGDSEFGPGAAPFIAKFDPTGALQWSKKYSNATISSTVLAVDGMGNLWLAGTTGTGGGAAPSVVYEGTTISGNGADIYVFVLKVSGQDGSLLAKTSSSGGSTLARGITADALGNVFVTGEYNGMSSFGGQVLGGAGGAYVFKAQANGTTAWATSFGALGGALGSSVGVDPQGPILVQGSYAPSIDLGGVKLMSQQGSVDLFVGSFDNVTGAPMGGISIGSDGSQRGSMALSSTGTRWFVGATAADITFGCDTHKHMDMDDAFIAAVDANGICLSSHLYAGMLNQAASQVIVGAQGRAAVLGTFTGPFGCDGKEYMPNSTEDTFVGSYESDGTFRWMRQFGSTSGTIVASGIAMNPMGHVWLAGTIMGNTEFGSSTTRDIFLAELLP